MKTIVSNACEEISVSKLSGNELIAYRCGGGGGRGSSHYAVLSKLSGNEYGFINLAYSTAPPAYIESSWVDAVNKAMISRVLVAFSSQDEMLQAILDRKF